MLLGILIFWGIAATSYRGGHITVDLIWANVGPKYQRMIDVFATLVLLFVVTVQTWTLFDKVTKYDMEAPLYVTTFAFVINKDKYNAMSDKQKKAIDNNCNTETAGKVGEHWGKMEDAGIEKIKAESGHEVYKLTPEQIGLWKKAAEPLVKTWGEGVKKQGGDPDTALTELKASLTKYNALAQ
jgi:hypothetical protein